MTMSTPLSKNTIEKFESIEVEEQAASFQCKQEQD